MEPVLFFAGPGCAFGAVIAFEWSGLPYRLCSVPFGDDAANRLYREISPLGQTPGMIADGKTLCQSIAILKHIAAASSDPRMGPRSGAEMDRLNMVLGFLHTSFYSAFLPCWEAMQSTDSAANDVYRALGAKLVHRAHTQLELLLGEREWLVGDGPTIADGYFAGLARWNDLHKAIDQRAFSKVTALRARLDALPAVQFAYDIENGRPAASTGQFKGFAPIEEVVGTTTGFV